MFKVIGMFVIVFAVLVSGIAFAKDDVKVGGKVKSIDTENISFVVVDDLSGKDVVIKVNPATDFEAKSRKNKRFTWDKDVEFEYLQVGDWVEVEYSNGNDVNIIAEDVGIYR